MSDAHLGASEEREPEDTKGPKAQGDGDPGDESDGKIETTEPEPAA